MVYMGLSADNNMLGSICGTLSGGWEPYKPRLNPTGIKTKAHNIKEFYNGFIGKQLIVRNGICNGNL